MSNQSGEWATVADMLSEQGGQKEIILKTMSGKKVLISKADVGTLADIMKVARDSELDQMIWLVFKCLVNPRLKMDEVRRLGHPVILEIGSEIAKFSGLDKESMSKTQNLLGIGPSEQSS